MINNDDYLKQFTDLQANFIRPMARYGEVAAKLTEELTNNSVNSMNRVLEEYQSCSKRLQEAKKWEDYLTLQNSLREKATSEMLDASQKCSQIMAGALSDMGKIMQDSYEKTSEQTQKAASNIQKTASNFANSNKSEGKGKNN